MVRCTVLRLGHRPERDQRVTTHVGLTARALGADGMFLAARDKGIVESIEGVVGRWGGQFFVKDGVSWRQCTRNWQQEGGTVVHLTMYGLPLMQLEEELRAKEQILVAVGAEKVPGELYRVADYNVSVGCQPHSEIAGLAVFLDHLFQGEELSCEYPGAAIRIIPSECGKQTAGPEEKAGETGNGRSTGKGGRSGVRSL